MALSNRNPYDTYRETQVTTANQGKLIVMLYDGALRFLTIASENMASARTYDVANTNILKAQDIITELILSLNMKEGGEIASNLFNLYMYFKKRLLDANIAKDPEILKPVMKNLLELRNAWEQISAKESKNDRGPVLSKGNFSIEG